MFLLRLKPNLDLRITAHPEFRYTVQTNADGLRDEPFEGTFDIAALGDSFTFGFGVEAADAWPAQLEATTGARVVNLGWVGWSSYAYPEAIRRYAIPSGARTWVWAFFVNDLRESAGAAAFITAGGSDFKAQAYTPPPFPFNLRLFGTLAALLDPQYRLLPDSGDRLFQNADFTMLLSRYAWTQTDPTNPEVERGWALTAAALAEAAQLAADHDARLLLVYIPPREQVYWLAIREQMPDVDIAQLEAVADRLQSLARAQGIDFLNLLPGFQAEAETRRIMLYFPSDGHWNSAGHRLAAALIASRLDQP